MGDISDQIYKGYYWYYRMMATIPTNICILFFFLIVCFTPHGIVSFSIHSISPLQRYYTSTIHQLSTTTTTRRVLTQQYLYKPLENVQVTSVKTGQSIDVSHFLQQQNAVSISNTTPKSMIVFATYAADFNAIEYVQRLRYYLPMLYQRGITNIGLVLNAEAEAAKLLVDLVDLPTDVEDTGSSSSRSIPSVQLFIDPFGHAGRAFGVARGFNPNDNDISPFLKLFVMLFGVGAWATLPAVISGYIGNPFFGQPWIEDALAVGQVKKRWPDMALILEEEAEVEVEEEGIKDVDSSSSSPINHRKGQRIKVKVNKFAELPYGFGEWKRRPLELATLRLQNMLDISIKYWEVLAPTEEALKNGVLTQLGGCIVVDSSNDKVLYKWRDPGICAVANFEDLLRRVPV